MGIPNTVFCYVFIGAYYILCWLGIAVFIDQISGFPLYITETITLLALAYFTSYATKYFFYLDESSNHAKTVAKMIFIIFIFQLFGYFPESSLTSPPTYFVHGTLILSLCFQNNKLNYTNSRIRVKRIFSHIVKNKFVVTTEKE